jgi:hypothetical protein
MMNDIPELSQILYTILDLLDSKKNLTKISLYRELQLEFSHITEETLIPNLDFCVQSLMEAELIQLVGEYYRVTGKGKKVLLSDTNELGLEELKFYAAHGENFYGLPPGGLKLKTYIKKTFNNRAREYALYAAVFFCIGLIYRFLSTGLDNSIEATIGATIDRAAGAKDMTDGLEKELDKNLNKVIKEPLR